MAIVSLIIALICIAIMVVTLLNNKRLEQRAAEQSAEAERLRQYYETESLRIQTEARAAVENAQALVDQQVAELKQDAQNVRQHYEEQAKKAQQEADAFVAKVRSELEPLRKYANLRDPEAEATRTLSQAFEEATALRSEAQKLLDKAREAAANEQGLASQKVKELYQRADAIMKRANLESARVVADAEKRAEQIGGDAYAALRDKQTLEKAIQALWNVTDGYGDRYVVPSRSLLDDLADDFGYTEAGEALRAARDQSRRLVEEKLAATCNYTEPDRRDRANRFIVDAFNGRVDAILTRVKHDNYGTLEQEIRDAFSLVNLNGLVFRDARILPSYLDARLAELKWATVVQELRLQEREEQQRIREQMREEEKARREYERAMRDAALEQEMLRKAMEKAQEQVQHATAQQKAQYEQQLGELAAKLKEAEERGQRALSMAQQTRHGHVYIISNIGSFGEHVYKIGLTRRLEPQDRIDELGDSSVPFQFDVHALIESEDAPALESKLHKHFVEMQVNKINPRKEFFRVDLQHIREEIQKLGLNTKWTMTATAKQFRETRAIEKQMKENPAFRDSWAKRQVEMELLDRDIPESKPGATKVSSQTGAPALDQPTDDIPAGPQVGAIA